MNTKTLLSVLALIVVVLAGGAYAMSNNNVNQEAQVSLVAETPSLEVTTAPPSPADIIVKKYKDGTYNSQGDYRSPGGAETINVTLTLKNNIIVDSSITPLATRPKSKEMQADFVANYKQFVTGKNIDEVNLSIVSGSSLTSTGFNAAVEKIKTEAKA